MASRMSADGRLCKVCEYKGTTVTAVKVCEMCINLCLCSDCAGVHGSNKATRVHVLAPITFREDRTRDGTCGTHGMQLLSFCVTCSKQCCHLCIQFDHGDHVVGTVGEIFALLMEEVKSIKESQEWQPKELKEFAKELLLMESTNIKGQKELVREIEDHAKKCIEKINEEKEALKDRVRDCFEITKEMTKSLEKVPTLTLSLEASYSRANQLLQVAEPHPLDLKELIKVKDDMVEAAKQFDELDKDQYWKAYNQFWQEPLVLVPRRKEENEKDVGDLESRSQQLDGQYIDLIFEKELEVDNSDINHYIPCVTALDDDFYAVAHPTVEGKPSGGVDIYRYPGELVNTITDHIHPLYDMASTSDGKLAVLSDGTSEGTSAVKVFDPMNGFIRATNDLAIQGPQSFDINPRGQYVILSHVVIKDESKAEKGEDDEEGKDEEEARDDEEEQKVRMVTIVNEDGSTELTHVIDEENDVGCAVRISCSASYIYIIGVKDIAVFQHQKGCKLVRFTTCDTDYWLSDISASYFNYITACHLYGQSGAYYLERYKLNGEKVENMVRLERLNKKTE